MNPSPAALLKCLETEAGLIRDFIAVLQDEARVLEEGASDTALSEVTARKNAAADALARAAEERNAQLAAMAFGTDGPGLQAAAEAHPMLAEPRRILLELAEQARSFNENNGQIIQVFLEHNERTLEVLRRIASRGDVYDASGRKRSATSGSSRNIKA